MKKMKRRKRMNKGALGGIVLGVVIAGSVIGGFTCMKKIPAGYVGICYDFSKGGC